INPLLGTLFVPALYYLGRELYDEQTGRLATALACFTPFIFNMSSEFMNHASALLFTTLFLIYYFRTLRNSAKTTVSNPLLAGLFLGLVVNIRPYTAAAIALPFGLYGLWLAVREPGHYISRFALMLLTLAATSRLLLIYNWLTNGHPLLFGYVVKWGQGHEVGFGKSAWGPMHTPLKGLLNTGNDHNLLNKFLFEWPMPSILPTAILFASGTRDRRDWLLLASFLSLTWAHFFYWFHNVCFGPRFLYESSPALLLLTVRGFSSLGTLLRRAFRLPTRDSAVAILVGRTLPLMLLFMAGSGLPPLFRLYRTYGGVSRQVQRNVQRLGLKNALVFCEHLGNGFSFNSLNLDGDVVYAKDHGPLINAALTVRYPERSYFFARGDTIRPIEDIRFPQSRLRTVLGYLNTFLLDSVPLDQYRYVFWPFADLPPFLPDPAPPVVDYREASREIFTGRRTMDDYLPAIGCWLLKDAREHLKIFSAMNDVQHFISDRFKFTLLNITPGGEAAIYDIRPATGQEITLPR
ncbi:MAG: glycosyltransferase family 39 protein, partial [candidate division WOR-3 bacterium]